MLYYLDYDSKFKPLNSKPIDIDDYYTIEANSPEEAIKLWNEKELESIDFKNVKHIANNSYIYIFSFTVTYGNDDYNEIILLMSMDEIISIFQSHGLIYDKRFEGDFFSLEMYKSVYVDSVTLAPSIIFKFSQDDYSTMFRYNRDEIKLEDYVDIINKKDKLAYLKIMKDDQARLEKRLKCIASARDLFNTIYNSLSDDELLKYSILEMEDDSDEL